MLDEDVAIFGRENNLSPLVQNPAQKLFQFLREFFFNSCHVISGKKVFNNLPGIP
ncbi:hypothetical protein DAPPUDRAFT_233844 [Daphnia pulex]|uniref:Uncharacterized protein n=1 Tax=Daphnia pulex TaxID=6669 RepID=E9FVW9_DAPPU|nr:hypothetical protein DAPPUDRAFT_233844 [Daphnia pulex]|eukprot:EFX89029.1 hypothetical protein DAPPUDRAFT_233844 [Daphnia pulex]